MCRVGRYGNGTIITPGSSSLPSYMRLCALMPGLADVCCSIWDGQEIRGQKNRLAVTRRSSSVVRGTSAPFNIGTTGLSLIRGRVSRRVEEKGRGKKIPYIVAISGYRIVSRINVVHGAHSRARIYNRRCTEPKRKQTSGAELVNTGRRWWELGTALEDKGGKRRYATPSVSIFDKLLKFETLL